MSLLPKPRIELPRDPLMLHRLHSELTKLIVSQHRGRFLDAERSARAVARLLGSAPRSITEADELRRLIHRALLEAARVASRRVAIEGRFEIPDVETAVLARAGKLDRIVVRSREIEVEYLDTEGKTVYGDPVGYGFFIRVAILDTFDGRRAEIGGELFGLLGHDIDYEIALKMLSPRELRKMIESGELRIEELEIDERARVELALEEDPRIMVLLHNRCLDVAWPCIGTPRGVINIVDNDDYILACLWREEESAMRFPIVEELRSLGLDAYVDRIYHEVPAEYDAGAESRAIVHVSFERRMRLESPESEVEVAKTVDSLLRLLLGD